MIFEVSKILKKNSRIPRFLTVFMLRVWLQVRFPGQWWLLYVAADQPNARGPDQANSKNESTRGAVL